METLEDIQRRLPENQYKNEEHVRLSLVARADQLTWTGANIRPGRYTKHGFRHLPEVDISFQYIQASRAWEVALRIAKRLRVPVSVDFVWSDKPEAAHPGEQARMQWSP